MLSCKIKFKRVKTTRRWAWKQPSYKNTNFICVLNESVTAHWFMLFLDWQFIEAKTYNQSYESYTNSYKMVVEHSVFMCYLIIQKISIEIIRIANAVKSNDKLFENNNGWKTRGCYPTIIELAFIRSLRFIT